MTLRRSTRPIRRARQVELVAEQLRRDPHVPVPELARMLQSHGLGVHVRTVYIFRAEARPQLPPAPPKPPPSGWAVGRARVELGIGRPRLLRMMAVTGMPDPVVEDHTGIRRWPEAVWQALADRFEAAVLRRPAVFEAVAPGRPYATGITLPPPAGADGRGHWWLPADVEAWLAAGHGRPAQPVTWWTRYDLSDRLQLHPDAVDDLLALPGFPTPVRGRWNSSLVRSWVRGHRDGKDRVAGTATLDLRAAAGVVMLRYDTVRKYRSIGVWPAPDGWHGRTPRWDPATLRAWQRTRTTPSPTSR